MIFQDLQLAECETILTIRIKPFNAKEKFKKKLSANIRIPNDSATMHAPVAPPPQLSITSLAAWVSVTEILQNKVTEILQNKVIEILQNKVTEILKNEVIEILQNKDDCEIWPDGGWRLP